MKNRALPRQRRFCFCRQRDIYNARSIVQIRAAFRSNNFALGTEMTLIGERSPFFALLRARTKALGGLFNAHLHIDRAGTLDDRYFAANAISVLDNSHISLQRKHHLIGAVHAGPAYRRDDLVARANATIDIMVAAGTTRADSMVDVTDDGIGLTALETMREVSVARRPEIDLRLAAYSPLGFKDAEPGRWRV
jgi:hypothetical protein